MLISRKFLKSKIWVPTRLGKKFEELAKSGYAVKQSLIKEGYEVYNEVANRLQDGRDKLKLAANENAFMYTRMAKAVQGYATNTAYSLYGQRLYDGAPYKKRIVSPNMK